VIELAPGRFTHHLELAAVEDVDAEARPGCDERGKRQRGCPERRYRNARKRAPARPSAAAEIASGPRLGAIREPAPGVRSSVLRRAPFCPGTRRAGQCAWPGGFSGKAVGRRLRAALPIVDATARARAFADLDAGFARAAAAAPFAITLTTDFFSDRIGGQIHHPIYGISLGALCVRR
jgi:hypothetical protein